MPFENDITLENKGIFTTRCETSPVDTTVPTRPQLPRGLKLTYPGISWQTAFEKLLESFGPTPNPNNLFNWWSCKGPNDILIDI